LSILVHGEDQTRANLRMFVLVSSTV